ncbi:DUF4038 domain-containing protein [Streptomyces canus]|uniref:apiosidase-like domain-containing protein n=1 Tax=Streptomyces canus TaxID=58343 RepID=UPI002E331CCB|nr:DUF4038 domain-containing protein [Streptomyces canus]
MADPGLHGRTGTLTIGETDPAAASPFRRHGFWRMSPGGRSLVHADGTPALIAADTAWGLPWRATAEQARTYAVDRAAKGFNAALLMSVMPDMDARGPRDRTADGGFDIAFEDLQDGGLDRMVPAYFQRLDELLGILDAHGIVPVLQTVFHGFGCKGLRVAGPVVPPASYARYCHYLVARYGASPAVWLVGADGRGDEPQIAAGGREIEAWDGYHQPTGIHYRPHGPNNASQEASWLDFQWCRGLARPDQPGRGPVRAGHLHDLVRARRHPRGLVEPAQRHRRSTHHRQRPDRLPGRGCALRRHLRRGEVRTAARDALSHLLGHPLADRTGEAWRHHGQVVLGQPVGGCARGAVRSGNGGLNVMLINKSAQNAARVSLSYAGYTPAAGAVTTISYAKGGTALTTAKRGTAVAQTLPPYSITTLQLKPTPGTAGVGKPTPVPTPTAATLVVSASGTTGTRAQGEIGAPVGRPTPSSTSGPLASTGVSNAVTYSAPSVACWSSLPAACWCFADVAAGLCTGSKTG